MFANTWSAVSEREVLVASCSTLAELGVPGAQPITVRQAAKVTDSRYQNEEVERESFAFMGLNPNGVRWRKIAFQVGT